MTGAIPLVWLAIALPLLGFVVNGAIAFRAPESKSLVSAVGVGSVLGAFVVSVAVFLEVLGTPSAPPRVVELWHWISADRLHVDMALQVDQLSTVMMLVITGVGSLIHIFSVGYMRADVGYARYFAYLNLFVAFMLVLVLGSSLPVLFIGWEGVGLCSFLLIAFWYTDDANASAGLKAFIVNRIGDMGVLIAMFLLWNTIGTLDFLTIGSVATTAFPAGGAAVTLITAMLFVGCVGKSAQIPLYVWLPDAMAGPTPVSALIHAATMVTAGVYLVARTGVLFALAPATDTVVAGIGAATALFAAVIALKQYDIKKVLAFSTVSQLGYMFVGVGAGAFTAGIFHVITHAFFKALLFLGAGSVIHAMHHATEGEHLDPQDMRNMGGLRRAMPWTAALMIIATLALAGVPPFAGFFSKDEILASAFARGAETPVFRLYWAMGLVTAFLTAIYMARLIAMTFFGESRLNSSAQHHLHEAPAIMTGPLVLLGALAAVGGALNLPAFAGGSLLLHTWLHPVFEAAELVRPVLAVDEVMELPLVLGAVAVALAGLAIGWRITTSRPIVPAADAPADHGLAGALAHRLYIDEIYEAMIVKPVMWTARNVLWQGVDRGLVDGVAVNGLARVFEGAGWVGSRLQTGQIGFYVVLFAAGAVWLLAAMLG